ncbi:MAG: hypothetical protein ABH952_08250 [Candidatus Omnitrophota bacterium]
MKKSIILLILLTLLATLPAYAAMKLYISDDCVNCDVVLRDGKEIIRQLQDKGELDIINLTNVKTDLPALPALVDEKTVLIGTGIVEYLLDAE